MSNSSIEICRDYAEAVFQRVNSRLTPETFEPNWDDQPSRNKIYQQVERLQLSLNVSQSIAPFGKVIERIGTPQLELEALTTEQLATSLLLAHGLLRRRVTINWNPDNHLQPRYVNAIYSRGTASGGGLYPTEIYWASGQSGPLVAGVYHYDTANHALARLQTGDISKRLREALFQHPAAQATDQFLLITLNFWKNAFKYANFSYHVVTQDLGALLGSLRLLAAGFGSDLQYLFWFQDQAVNDLLGLDTLAESVFAVVPLPMNALAVQRPARSFFASTISALDASARTVPFSLREKQSYQRSQTVLRFPLVEDVHRSALIESETCPPAMDAYKAGYESYRTSGERLTLPQPDLSHLQNDLASIFQKRQSSFGRFSNARQLSAAELGTLLYCAASVRSYLADLKQPDGAPHFTRLMVFVNHIQHIKTGIYAYDPISHSLWTVQEGSYTDFLQNQYFLLNYNMEQVGAVVMVLGKLGPMLEVYGNRGYRILNAEVGMVAQGLYMATTAVSCGCGAILGFNNLEFNRVLGLEGTDERTILALLIGHQRQGFAGFDLPIV
jgi:SagB-type dehydrogenase family enzyme